MHIYNIHTHIYIYNILYIYTSYTCKVGYASNRFVFSFHPGYPDEPLPSIVKDPNLSNVKLSWAQPPGCSSLIQFIYNYIIQLKHWMSWYAEFTGQIVYQYAYESRNHESFNIRVSIRSPSLSLSLWNTSLYSYIQIDTHTHSCNFAKCHIMTNSKQASLTNIHQTTLRK